MKKQILRFISFVVLSGLLGIVAGCSSAKKVPELSKLRGKKVALVEVEGEPTQRSITEVAFVNQIAKDGTFILVSKERVDQVRALPGIDAGDHVAVAKRAGADYALKIEVVEMSAETHEGYNEERVYDSQLAAERGEEEGTTTRIFKVKSLDGNVKFDVAFTDVNTLDVRKAEAFAEDKIVKEGKKGAIHLPPRLGFLEKLSNRAFREFFEKYD